MQTVSISNSDHYVWGDVCDGWRLLQRPDMSVIQERVPPGAAEVLHHHNLARQFFYILSGEATMVFEGHEVEMQQGNGLEISPGVKHQFKNQSKADVLFLVISVPAVREDRVNS